MFTFQIQEKHMSHDTRETVLLKHVVVRKHPDWKQHKLMKVEHGAKSGDEQSQTIAGFDPLRIRNISSTLKHYSLNCLFIFFTYLFIHLGLYGLVCRRIK